MLADRVHGHIGDLLAVGQVQLFDVVTVLGERSERVYTSQVNESTPSYARVQQHPPERLVAHRLAAAQRQELQEPAASLRDVLDHRALDVALEIKQIDLLPVAAVQRVHVPVPVHLGAAAQRDHVQVREDAQQYFARQLACDLRVIGLDVGALFVDGWNTTDVGNCMF